MSTVPDGFLEQITFYEEHLPIWTANATQIGLTSAQCTALSALVTAARTQFNGTQSIRSASRAQTANFHIKLAAMNEGGSDLIKIIRAYADFQNDPTVYTKAEIPAPASPTPVGPPGTPTDFNVSIDAQTGAFTILWKCSNPTGCNNVVYEVQRRIGSAGEGNAFAFIGSTGRKFFVDDSLPAGSTGGADGITYRITGVRSTKRGNTNGFTITFGAGMNIQAEENSSGESGESDQMKIAA